IHGALAPAATPLVLNGEGLRGGHHVHRREKCGSNDERAGLCSEFHCGLAGKLLPPESEQHNVAALATIRYSTFSRNLFTARGRLFFHPYSPFNPNFLTSPPH